MRLISLKLINFQGMTNAQFDLGGANANIYGDNATGKTTLFNAVTWLLFGRASTGAKNFNPKTKGPDGDLHYLDHEVEACFSLNDGQLLILKKVYKEDYKKKRGSAQEEFNGHVIDYFIDTVPVKEKEYNAALNNYIGTDEHIKMLMMPDYFAETLPWEQRRRILLEMCGDVTDADVLDGNPELADLLGYLAVPGATGKHYTVDEYKKIASGKRTEINKELQTIPARIDEAKKAIPDISGINLSKIELSITEANAIIGQKEEEKRYVLSGDSKADTVRKQISALQTQLAENRAEYTTFASKQNEEAYAEVARLKAEQNSMQTHLDNRKGVLNTTRRNHDTLQATRQILLEKYQKVNAELWTGDEVCPTCQRPLPEDEVQKAKEAFNLSKSQRLEAINQEGMNTCNKETIAVLANEIIALAEEIRSLETSLSAFDTIIRDAEQKAKPILPFENTEVYKAAMQQINELSTSDSQVDKAVSHQASVIDNEIKVHRIRLDALLAEKSKLSLAEQQTKRMNELETAEKRLSQEYESLQRGVYLCEEFIKAKVSMLTDRINSKFNSVRFRLFVEQINGGIKEDCEVMVPADERMIPYILLNGTK